jgi:adenylate cyclase, class 2
MNEVEIKFLEVDKDAIIAQLEDLGAKRVFEGDIDARYFDTDSKKLKKQNITLRLRTRGDIIELTCKERNDTKEIKSCKETEINVSDMDAMISILATLSLKEYRRITKHRISYLLDDIHFELDTPKGLPTFLEIEADKKKTVQKGAKMLGLSLKDGKPWSTRQVIEYYKGK